MSMCISSSPRDPSVFTTLYCLCKDWLTVSLDPLLCPGHRRHCCYDAQKAFYYWGAIRIWYTIVFGILLYCRTDTTEAAIFTSGPYRRVQFHRWMALPCVFMRGAEDEHPHESEISCSALNENVTDPVRAPVVTDW
jgi:hypothetical protein